jgi:hypothetical protein
MPMQYASAMQAALQTSKEKSLGAIAPGTRRQLPPLQ